jgi:hypothetical protein
MGISAEVQGERRAPRMSNMQSADEGPVNIIAEVVGNARVTERTSPTTKESRSLTRESVRASKASL